MTSKKLLQIFLLLSIYFLMAVFSSLNRYFWFDEAFTFKIASLPFKELLSAVQTDNNPPLYYLLIHYILKLGSQEMFLRLPSLLFGSFSLLTLYFLVDKIGTRKTAFFSGLLFSVSPLTVFISSEARPHILATFILMLLISLFIKLEKNPDRKNTFFFIIIATLGLYIQYYIAIAFIPFTLIILYKNIHFIKKWAIICFFIFALISPWIISSIPHKQSACWCPNSFISLPISLVSPSINGLQVASFKDFLNQPIHLLLIMFIAASLNLVLFIRGYSSKTSLSLIYLVPLAFLSLFGIFIPLFSPKAFSIYSPIFLIMVTLGLQGLKKTNFKKGLAFTLPVLLTVISFTQILESQKEKNQFFNLIERVVLGENKIVAHNSIASYYPFVYYTDQKYLINILIGTNPLSSETLKYIGGEKAEINREVKWLLIIENKKWTSQEERNKVITKFMSDYSINQSYLFGENSLYYLKHK